MDAAIKQGGTSVVTIFVNPMQFGANEDFDSYPRMLEQDTKLVEQLGVNVLFAPSMDEMYPRGQSIHTQVTVPELSNTLCGSNRLGHFDGVTTVVSKLFNLVQPDIAFFGEKDWQQLTIIKKMVADLDFPIEIVGVPTQREDDGLATSSRNQYLSESERRIAPTLYRVLCDAAVAARSGGDDPRTIEEFALEDLENAGFQAEYVAIRDAVTLSSYENGYQLRIFGAAQLGKARLIDNIAV